MVLHIGFHAQAHYSLRFRAERQDWGTHDADGEVRPEEMQPEHWDNCPRELAARLDALSVWRQLQERVAVRISAKSSYIQ